MEDLPYQLVQDFFVQQYVQPIFVVVRILLLTLWTSPHSTSIESPQEGRWIVIIFSTMSDNSMVLCEVAARGLVIVIQ